jgi:hypothetical protein
MRRIVAKFLEENTLKFVQVIQLRRIAPNENAKKIQSSHQTLYALRLAIYLAQKVGAGLGRRQILFRSMP